MAPVLPRDASLIHEPYIRLVDQGCRLQGMIAAFSVKIGSRKAPQFVINERQKPFDRVLIASAPLMQNLRNFVLWPFYH